jgi:starch-binding outer membrane protein SusE/F
MKLFNKIAFTAITSVALLLTACEKAEIITTVGNGKAPVLTASTAAVAPTATDSNSVSLKLDWTTPAYASADPATYKYIVQIDSAGKNFTKGWTAELTGTRTLSFVAKDLNKALLDIFGFQYNVAYDMDVKVTSSYANNNEKLTSNVLRIKMTPYKTPPKVLPPFTDSLFIIGSASASGWTGGFVPEPSQAFTKIDSVTFGGIFYLVSGEYLLLPRNGSYSYKLAVPDNSIPNVANGGPFLYSPFNANLGQNFKSPAASGWYKIVVDFQLGRYTVTPYANPLPTQLYVTGDATASSWTNNPPVAQKMTQLTAGVFRISFAMTPGKYYKFLSSPGNWQPQFGPLPNSGYTFFAGTLGANYGSGNDPDAIQTPGTAGTYTVTVNFVTNSYKVQ